MHLHILGIGGTFMGGLAVLARQAGHTVTGCDAAVYPPMSDQLRAQGIDLHEGYDAEQLTRFKADMYVVGNAMTRGKPVIEAILDQGLPYTSGPQWLCDHVLNDKWVLAVAGTHGKTTTTAMLAWMLEFGGLNPSFLIGGVPKNFDVSARLTDSPFFVIEADEYDTAFFDKRSKFVHYRPRTAILNNLEYDHADIFPDVAAIETQFHHLVRMMAASAKVIVNGKDEALSRVLKRGCWSEAERFGVADDWHAVPSDNNGFDVQLKGITIGHVDWTISGTYNQMNALAAIAAARHAGVSPKVSFDALTTFQNVRRRMETRGTMRGITVYDDFAHHPTAIKVTIEGLRRQIKPGERIIAVFEPRSNTMKLGSMRAALPDALVDADLVCCYANNLGWDAGEALQPIGTKSSVFSDVNVLVENIALVARPGDHVLIMSNGGFGGIHQKLLTRLAQ